MHVHPDPNVDVCPGTGLYYEDVRLALLTKGRGHVSEDEINACVMADLQLMQDEEMQGQLPLLINKVRGSYSCSLLGWVGCLGFSCIISV